MGIQMIPRNANVCILRTDRIGDVVLTLPMASVIKSVLPEAIVTFVVREYTATIPSNSSSVDKVISISADCSVFEIAAQLKLGKFDCIFIVSPSFKIALASALSGIPVRVGTGYRWYSFLFNRRVADHRSEVKFHEAEYNVRMLQNIGINYELTKENARYGLNVPDSVCTDIESLLTSVGLGGGQEYCIIHPGSGGSAVDLPESSFIELIGLIYEQTQLRVVLTGSQGEYELCERVGGGKAINLAGKLTLLQLLGIIEKSFIFVSNSTGPLHIAAALHKPVIGFFPKVRVCSAERWGPYAMNVYVFKPSISCSNCTVAQCQKLDCMRTIDVNQVLQRIITFSEMV